MKIILTAFGRLQQKYNQHEQPPRVMHNVCHIRVFVVVRDRIVLFMPCVRCLAQHHYYNVLDRVSGEFRIYLELL